MFSRKKVWRLSVLALALAALAPVTAMGSGAGGFGGGGRTLPAVQGYLPHPPRVRQPLEGGPRVESPPYFSTAPAAHSDNDPHWSANVRANTDATTYAQQEPSIGVNPLNPLNVVVANKDERSAPSPGTATKEVWIETT